MAKVFGVHQIELLPGVSGKEFEKFIRDEYAPLATRIGWKGYVTKADRGEQAGKYFVIWEIDSVEQRDRFFPDTGQPTEEALRLLQPEFDQLNKKYDALATIKMLADCVEQVGS